MIKEQSLIHDGPEPAVRLSEAETRKVEAINASTDDSVTPEQIVKILEAQRLLAEGGDPVRTVRSNEKFVAARVLKDGLPIWAVICFEDDSRYYDSEKTLPWKKLQ